MAPNSKFVILISAVDQVTAVAKRVDKSLADLAAPARQALGSTKALADATGITKVGSAIGDVARQSLTAARGLAEMATPFGAVFGAASIAGIAETVGRFAALGGETSRLSAATGVGVERLQSLQGAARLAGSSSEALAGGLEGIAHTMQEINAFRNVEGMALFNMLGIGTGSLKNPRNPAAVLRQLSAEIVRFKNPMTQAKLAEEAMGAAGRDLLPLLRQGPQAFDAFVAAAERYGYQLSGPQVAAARQTEQAWTELQLAGEGMATMLGSKLAPVLTPMLHDLAEWIAANRQWITTDVADYVQQIGDAARRVDWKGFASDTRAVIDDVKDFTNEIGGAKVAAIAFFGLMAAEKIAAVVSLGAAVGDVAFAAGKMAIRIGAMAFDSLPALATQGALAAEALGKGKLATALLDVGAAIEGISLGTLTAVAGEVAALAAAGWSLYRLDQEYNKSHPEHVEAEKRAAGTGGVTSPLIGGSLAMSQMAYGAGSEIASWLGLAQPGAAGPAIPAMAPVLAAGVQAYMPSAADSIGIGGSPWNSGPLELTVKFLNAPPGAEFEVTPNGNGPRVRLNVQHSMPGGPL